MASSYRFIERPGVPSQVLAWFRALPHPRVEFPSEHSMLLYFKDFGPLVYGNDGKVDTRQSPIATVLLPREVRRVLWTVGEIHFLARPLRRVFPALYEINCDLASWLATHECIYPTADSTNPYGPYLEGSVRHSDSQIFGLDSGMDALRVGRYFVSNSDNDLVLDKLCSTLRLRGIDCAEG